LPQSLPKKQ
jgi:hypothetical protein